MDFFKVDPNVVRIANFCNTSSESYDCGFGKCAETLDHCKCDEGYVYSNYFWNIPNCYESTARKPAVFLFLGTLSAFLAVFAFYVAYHTYGTLRQSAMVGAISEILFMSSLVAMVVEGYWGPMSVTLMWLHSLALVYSAMVVMGSLLQTFLSSGSEHAEQIKNKASRVFTCIWMGIPTACYLTWLYPVQFVLGYHGKEEGVLPDWKSFNNGQYLFSVSVMPIVFVFIMIPLILSVGEIQKVIATLEKNMQDPTKMISLLESLRTARTNMLSLVFAPSCLLYGGFLMTVDLNTSPIQYLLFTGNFLSMQGFLLIPLQFTLASGKVLGKNKETVRRANTHQKWWWFGSSGTSSTQDSLSRTKKNDSYMADDEDRDVHTELPTQSIEVTRARRGSVTDQGGVSTMCAPYSVEHIVELNDQSNSTTATSG